MGNLEDRVEYPLSKVTGPLVGGNLLDALKAEILAEPIFQRIFGCKGERIFTKDLPSYNETILPLIEFYWSRERVNNWDTLQTGAIEARIVLPVKFRGDVNGQRQIAALFQRFMNTRRGIFTTVSGLTELGVDTEYRYDKLLALNGLTLPVIEMTIPFAFDLKLFSQQNPELDLFGPLDGELVGFFEHYGFKLSNEQGDVLIDSATLVSTGVSN